MSEDKKIDIFTAEDFRIYMLTPIKIAEIANAKLAKLLGPKVFAKHNIVYNTWTISEIPLKNESAHTAYLFNIQPLKKEECAHGFLTQDNKIDVSGEISCVYCGVPLKVRVEPL